MKVTIEKSQLSRALTAVSKGMSSRSTMPILSGVFMEASGSRLTLRTTDLEISVQHIVDALIEEEGEVVVPGRLLNDIIKSLPDAAVLLSTDSNGLAVSCAESNFTLNTYNALDFPSFPQVNTTAKAEIAARDLQVMVKKAGKAVSRDESRPVLMGILTRVVENKMTMAATDSYRLSVVVKEIDGAGSLEIIIPGSVLEEVARISGVDDKVVISESENQIMFITGQTQLISRKIEGTYPNFEVLIPSEKTTTAVLNTSELLTAIKRVALASQNSGPVKMVFDPDLQKLTISSKTMEVASGSETINAQIDGEYLEIGFNHQYLTDGLSVIENEEVSFENSGPLKSGVFKTGGDVDFLYLTMPLRIDV